MGGVDLLDSLIGRYKIKIRSKKWYIRIFYHLLDVTIVNSWLLYKRAAEQNNQKPKLSLSDFRIEVAECLCKTGDTSSKPKGRPSSSNLTEAIEAKRKKNSATPLPPTDVRLDNLGHWPVWTENRQRCKKPKCNNLSSTVCKKCNIALCLQKTRNCFTDFHYNQ